MNILSAFDGVFIASQNHGIWSFGVWQIAFSGDLSRLSLYILAGDAGWELRVCPFLFPFPLYITLEFL